MEIQELWRIIRQRWRIVLAAVLACASVSLAYSLVSPVEYRAQGRVIISTYGSLGTAIDAYSGERVSQLRAPTYAQLIRSPEVATRASKALGGRFTPQVVQQAVDARISAQMPMIVVTATSRSPDDAVRILTTVERVFQDYVTEIERPGRDGSLTGVRLTGDAPTVERVGNPLMYAALAGLGGLIVGIVLALYRERTDRVIRNSAQVARVGVPYRGTVPADILSGGNLDDSCRWLAVECITGSGGGRMSRLLVTGLDDPYATASVAPAIAEGLASYGRQVVLVRTEPEAPSADQQNAVGFTDFLAGAASWEDCVTSTKVPNLREIGPGVDGRGVDALLIAPRPQGELIPVDEPDGHVVVLAPPLMSSPVGVALTAITDCCLLVATLGNSLVSDLTEAKATLEGLNIRILGIVLVRPSKGAGTQAVADDSHPPQPVPDEPETTRLRAAPPRRLRNNHPFPPHPATDGADNSSPRLPAPRLPSEWPSN